MRASGFDRRDFLKLGVVAACGLGRPGGATEATIPILVTDHGADRTGKQDCDAAVTKAIAALPKAGGKLVFPQGIYSFALMRGGVMKFDGFQGLVIEGSDSLLQFAGFARPFLFNGCSDLRINNLRIDYPRPPFSQGSVEAATANQFDIHIDAQFVVDGSERIQAINEYDRSSRLPKPNGIDAYGGVSSIQLIAPQLLRVSLTRNIGVKVGMTLVLRHQVYGSDAITLQSCERCRLAHVTIYTTPGVGVLGLGSTDITLQDYNVAVPPNSTRLLSTTADASHFTDCRGSLNISDCSFFGMGDDAVNACASYWRVVRSTSSTSFEVQARSGSQIATWQLPRPKDQLHYVGDKTFAPLFQSLVARAMPEHPNASISVEQTPPHPIPPGSLIVDMDAAPQLTVRNCHFLGNRARGIVAHSNVRIEESTFSGCSLSAILLAPDAHWMEGPTIHNVKITGNRFTNCGYGRPDDRRGIVCVDTAHDPHPRDLGVPRVNGAIQIQDNAFGPMPIAQIFCSASIGVSILRNTIKEGPRSGLTENSHEAIVLVGVSEALISDNVGKGGAIILEGCSDPLIIARNDGLSVPRAVSLPE